MVLSIPEFCATSTVTGREQVLHFFCVICQPFFLLTRASTFVVSAYFINTFLPFLLLLSLTKYMLKQ